MLAFENNTTINANYTGWGNKKKQIRFLIVGEKTCLFREKNV